MPGKDERNPSRQAKDKRKSVIYGILREEKYPPQARHATVHRGTSSNTPGIHYQYVRGLAPGRRCSTTTRGYVHKVFLSEVKEGYACRVIRILRC